MRVTRQTYRLLIEQHTLSHNVVLLSAGQPVDDLSHDPQRRAAILQHVTDLRRVASRIHAAYPTLLAAIESDLALLNVEPAGIGATIDAAKRIQAETARLLETIDPPRWTPLGLRHRRRRQLGRVRIKS